MKKIIAVNASPRTGWNTDLLVKEAAAAAAEAGAETEVIELYQLDKFTGCVSCFGCKTQGHLGRCVCRDGLAPVLEKIRQADGLILGTPNYLGNASAGFRALYERLIFQYLSYKNEPRSYNDRPIPVALIFTCNAPASSYEEGPYADMVAGYKNMLTSFIGPTELMIAADTMQVNDYEKYGWRFDAEYKKARREVAFPLEKEKARALGAGLLTR